jgi:hypothetical protein
MGHFWWYLLNGKDQGFEEKVADLENKDSSIVVRNETPELKSDWGLKVLTDADMERAAIVYRFMPGPNSSREEQAPFGAYIHGLAFLSKTDIHLNLIGNACELFFRALEAAMRNFGELKRKEFFESLYDHAFAITENEEDAVGYCALARKLFGENVEAPKITMDMTYQIKMLFDSYILKKYKKMYEDELEKEIAKLAPGIELSYPAQEQGS